MSLVAERLQALIRRQGTISFATFMDAALYDADGGFYATGGGAGRAGRDFVTSPEVGVLYGALVARHLDRVWARLAEPDPFVVVEAGAGRGRLASDVLRAAPDCASALRYLLVERSAALRARQHELLALEPIDEVLGPVLAVTDPDEPPEVVPGLGPIVCSAEELPAVRLPGVVLANELLDNLAVRIVERSESGWSEVRVGLDDREQFTEVVVPAPPDLDVGDLPDEDRGEVTPGVRLPVPVGAAEWLERVAGVLAAGEVVLVDYGASWSELAERGQAGWLRTYRAHGRGGPAFEEPGTQDLTVDVPVEALHAAAARVGFEVATDTSQADWLRDLGIDQLATEASQAWESRAGVGDLAAIAARSRVLEAAALTDPTGLGAHRITILRPTPR